MSDETPTRRIAREANAPGAWILALAALMGGGGLGSFATGSSTTTELRETRAQIVGEIRRLADKIDAEATKTADHAARLRTLEAHGVPRRVDEIERRVDALEKRVQ